MISNLTDFEFFFVSFLICNGKNFFAVCRWIEDLNGKFLFRGVKRSHLRNSSDFCYKFIESTAVQRRILRCLNFGTKSQGLSQNI